MQIKRLIADSFIEQSITKLTQEETGKRQYYRPVYSSHKWWARRPGALFRAMILLAASKSSELKLFERNESKTISTKSTFFRDHDLKDMIIFDPFMGGGTTLVEAIRMGAKVIGCDLNPVSHWIVRETLKQIELKKLERYFLELEKTAGQHIKSLYKTHCTACGNQNSDTLYTFWVRFIECPKCSKPVYLFKHYLLNEGIKRNQKISKKNPAIVVCPNCHGLNKFYGEDSFKCQKCKVESQLYEGVLHNGSFSCPHCSSKNSLIKTIRGGHYLKEKMIAIEYYCHYCRKRLYKSPDNHDIEKIIEAQKTFDKEKDNLLFPKQCIPKGSSSARWIAHNFHRYYQVFNARQILTFNSLISAINQIPEEEYRNAFITIFSNALEYNNMMTPYNYPHRKLHHLFNYHALPLTTMPVENCVWGVSDEGAGTFVNCYKRYVRAKEYCQRPFDKFKDARNKIQTVQSKKEKIEANFVSSFNELNKTSRGAWLHCRDSSHIPSIPDKSVDAVITDPPYFDNIHYSELSNFFYVWLKLFKPNENFVSDHVPIEEEAIVNLGMGKTEEGYYQLMKSVFAECTRVLKDEGSMMFTFHHSKPQAWWTVLRAIRDSGFVIVDYFPVTSEYKVNPHVRGKKALNTDLVIVCNKKDRIETPYAETSFDTIVTSAAQKIISINGESISDDRLYFYFVGEMLRIGSQSAKITFEIFKSVFDRSEEFIRQFRTYYPEIIIRNQDQQIMLNHAL